MKSSKKTSFIDTAKITIHAGKGGNGCTSFLSKGSIFKRTPDGGNGGEGGNVVIIADEGVSSLLPFQYTKIFKAKSGAHGGSNRKAGATGSDCIIRVPVGTIIKDLHNDLTYRDLAEPGARIIAARGGRGGLGNSLRRVAQKGFDGETRDLLMELRLVADIGLIGPPNAGRSSFMVAITHAHPKIAEYPFTSIEPSLAVYDDEERDERFTLIDIPSIIKGSHEGRGVGNRFVRHLERARVLVVFLDGVGKTADEVVAEYQAVFDELSLVDPALCEKQCCVVLNKIELLTDSAEYAARLEQCLSTKIYPISVTTGDGVEELLGVLIKVVNSI